MARILVVEDDDQLRANIREQLELNDHQVQAAPNGLRALELLATFSPNLILSDILMPKMDGISFIRALKQHPVYRSIPVVFLTAKITQTDKLEGLEAGAVDYLIKPFLERELLLKVKNLTHLQTEHLTHQPGQKNAIGTQNHFVSSFTQLLEQHFGDRFLTMEKMAEHMSMSPSAFKRNLKKYFGRSFSDLLKDHRLRNATTHLLQTDESLQSIAHQCGFSSLAYFSYFFKQVHGVSPLRYRQDHRLKASLD